MYISCCPKVSSLSQKVGMIAKKNWEGQAKFLLEKKKISTWHYIVWFPPGFHIVWPTSVLLNRPWLLYHAQMFKPSCHCHDVCQPTIFITKFQMCSLDLRLPLHTSLSTIAIRNVHPSSTPLKCPTTSEGTKIYPINEQQSLLNNWWMVGLGFDIYGRSVYHKTRMDQYLAQLQLNEQVVPPLPPTTSTPLPPFHSLINSCGRRHSLITYSPGSGNYQWSDQSRLVGSLIAAKPPAIHLLTREPIEDTLLTYHFTLSVKVPEI